jgi:type IV pilus assembly protein PilY1
MGDIAYSTPVIVGVPSLGAVSRNDPNVLDYLSFRNALLSKQETAPSGVNTASPTLTQVIKKVVYVGANDGQLHAFVFGVWDWRNQKWVYEYNSGDPYAKYIGQELWAYIPSNLVSELKDLALISYGNVGCKHRTMIDLSPQAWQVYIDHDGDGDKEWRTVLLGGERGGGDVYFAVDVTDPDSPILLWEHSVLKNLVYYTTWTVAPPWNFSAHGSDCNTTNKNRFCSRCTADNCEATNPTYRDWCRNRVSWCYTGPSPCSDAQFDDICAGGHTVGGYRMSGFRTNYETTWKSMAFSWSRPSVARFKSIDGLGITFYWGDPAGDGTPTGTFPNTAAGFSGDRHLAFVGGGFRYFDTPIDASIDALDLKLLRKPYLMAIDVETGRNIFRYVWPALQTYTPGFGYDPFLLLTRGSGTYYIPYSLNDPVALDVLDKRNPAAISVGDDGYVDHVYVGDLAGNFYGFKFNFETGTRKGIWVDVWLTKAVTETDSTLASKWSFFRSYSQPITVQPAASIDPDLQSLRLVLGTGKYDDVIASNDDKTDPAKMSLYNLKDALTQPNLDTGTLFGGQIISGSNLYMYVNPKCGNPSSASRLAKFDTGATWMKSTGVYDCNERNNASCANPCWKCIYDLTLPIASSSQCCWATNSAGACTKYCQAGDPGERITSKALIAGKLIFVTSFLPPPDPCTFTGQGYLYIFHYACSAFPDGFNPLTDPGDRLLAFPPIYKPGSTSDVLGLRLPLGAGMPSEPILDSSGKHVLIQMSTAEIKKIGVELLEKPFSFKGWRETTQESK